MKKEVDESSGVFWSQTNFENFCRSTSMHGWFFVVDDSLGRGVYAVCIRFFWLLVVLAVITLFLTLMTFLIQDYLQESITSTYVFEE